MSYRPPASPPPGGAPSQVVVVQAGGGGAMHQAMLSPFPVRMACPSCGNDIITNVHSQPGALTWLLAVALLCFFFPCSCCPFFCSSTQDVIHTCPACGMVIAHHRRC